MRTILRIMKTELRVLFFSPVAWMLLIVFAFQMGIEFCSTLTDQLRYQSLGYGTNNLTMSFIAGPRGIIEAMLSNLYLYIPLLTMGLMSRELGSGSIKLLYSSPLSNFQIIIGKYLSAIIYLLLLMTVLMLTVFFTIGIIKDPDIPTMLTALLGMFLTMAGYAAIGLFMSTITKYQVVAAVGTLALLGVLNYIGNVGQDIDLVRDMIYWLSIRGRSSVFINGMICTKDVFYFILIIAMFISLSILKLSGERLRIPMWKNISRYVIVFAGVILLGYISSNPKLIYYYDATANKQNTLTVNSQEVMKKIKGDITITSYANVLDDTWQRNSPRNRNFDVAKFEKYVRFRPDIKMKYVYYWGEATNKSLQAKYPDLSTKELFDIICENYDYNPRRFISKDELQDDISKEYGRFVRVIKAGDKVAYLRKYNDQYVDPFESEISAAFKTLVDKSPVIAVVSGHDERNVFDYGDKGYGPFATDITFRNALVNQGFTVRQITLGESIADDVDVVVIPEMKSMLSPQEEIVFDNYFNKGGNLLILGEPRRQAFMNPLVAKMGLQLSEGIIVSPSKEYLDDVVAAQVMPTALEVSPYFNTFIKKGYNIITPSACAVSVIEDKGFKVTEILASKSKGSWIEYQTTDFMNEKSEINQAKGEVEKSNSIMLHLSRKIGAKEQRIFVVGDVDCLATSELTKDRAGLNGANFSLIKELFRNFSYDAYPIETVRESAPDNKLYFKESMLKWVKLFFIWIFPLLLLSVSLWSWYKRRGR